MRGGSITLDHILLACGIVSAHRFMQQCYTKPTLYSLRPHHLGVHAMNRYRSLAQCGMLGGNIENASSLSMGDIKAASTRYHKNRVTSSRGDPGRHQALDNAVHAILDKRWYI